MGSDTGPAGGGRRAWPVVLAWALWLLTLLALVAVPLLDRLLRQAGRADLVQLTPGTAFPVVTMVNGATVGAVLASRRPRHPVGWLLLAVALSLTATAAAAQYQVALAVTTLAVVVAAGSLVLRFRRARGVERLQLQWVALAALVVAMAGVVVLAGLAAGVASASTLLSVAIGLCLATLPVAAGAAVLRYRLYDLDRIISRTLAYALLTVLLGLGDAGIVLGLGRLLPHGSSLAVAAATLATAALFQPARRRIQGAVDRRFSRARYDAARTIAAFSMRLRQQVDLTTLTAELVAVVDQTMQPTTASLWLRPSQPRSGTAAPPG